jgi:YD repeat-containing protein
MGRFVCFSGLVLLVGCAAGSDGDRSTIALTEVETTVQSAGSTTIRRAEMTYDSDMGGQLGDIQLSLNGAPAGRMEAGYTDGRLAQMAVIDVDGDQGQITYEYDDGDRLSRSQYVAPSVYTMLQQFDYEGDGDRAREVTIQMTPAGGTASTSYERFDYDEKDRLVEVTDIDGSSTARIEVDYDTDGRVERVTTYSGTSLGAIYEYAYDDQGRLDSVTTQDSERWDLSYDDNGYVAEGRQLDPGSGETITTTYTYGTGHVAGLRYTPDLPNSSLFDLRGQAFSTMDFLDLPAAELSADVPHPDGGDCGDGYCVYPEDASNCATDCGSGGYCGDGYCDYPETSSTCSTDCGSGGYCGDGYCDYPEDASTCASDCGSSDSCVGHCGGSATSCYCDSYCTSNGDCCPDYSSVCGV